MLIVADIAGMLIMHWIFFQGYSKSGRFSRNCYIVEDIVVMLLECSRYFRDDIRVVDISGMV